MIGQIKYAIIDEIYPVIFFGGIPHKDMRKLGTITSAGFLKFYSNLDDKVDIAVFGQSESLGILSQPEDAEIIKGILRI